MFIAYSDGVTEPENEFGEFGEERLIELIQRHRDQPLARISRPAVHRATGMPWRCRCAHIFRLP